MDSLLTPGAWSGGPAVLAAVTTDGLVVYGLVALVIGLIAWSKYREPPLADPFAGGRGGHAAVGNPGTRMPDPSPSGTVADADSAVQPKRGEAEAAAPPG